MMNQSILLAVISPVLITIGGLISWFLKSRLESLKEIENRAIERRIKTYEILVEPYILMFNARGNLREEEKALNKMTSLEYKKAAFNLVTFGSDKMVRDFNNLMQHFYHNTSGSDPNFMNNTLRYYCEFVLSIRKDLYNPKTKLKRGDTIKWLLKDFEKFDID